MSLNTTISAQTQRVSLETLLRATTCDSVSTAGTKTISVASSTSSTSAKLLQSPAVLLLVRRKPVYFLGEGQFGHDDDDDHYDAAAAAAV